MRLAAWAARISDALGAARQAAGRGDGEFRLAKFLREVARQAPQRQREALPCGHEQIGRPAQEIGEIAEHLLIALVEVFRVPRAAGEQVDVRQHHDWLRRCPSRRRTGERSGAHLSNCGG